MSASTDTVAELRVRYEAPAEPITSESAFKLRLATDGERSGAAVVAELRRPAVARDALLALADVLLSDLRRKASDRSDYLAFLQSKGKAATKELWNAQRAFLEAKYGEAAQLESPLDPILTVEPDGLSLEVFSADESAYARLHLLSGQAFSATQLQPGTTYLPLGPEHLRSLARIRSYRATTLELAPSRGGVEKALRVPYHWLRAFSQVQAASVLPAHSFDLAPVDLYNVLLSLRRRRAKKPPRALRYELVPGEKPRLVLEPWDLVLEGTGAPFGGTRPVVVRTWGRQRLQVLARLLPHVQRMTVHLVGAGLPAFYIFDLGDAQLTLALSGWTDSGWAGISTFDLLVAGNVDDLLAKSVLAQLQAGPRSLEQLEANLKRGRAEVRQALLLLIQRGVIVHDLPARLFQYRPLLAQPLDAERLRYRDAREQEAHRLLEVEGQVKLTRIHELAGEGTRIEGEVEDRHAHRTYRTSFTIDREGRTVDASCTSPQFRRSGLREGPTAPMIALRLLYARQQAELERARATPEGRKLIHAETRTFIRRTERRSATYRVSLDDRQVTVLWRETGGPPRMQRLHFASGEDARDEYFRRLGALADRGFIDSSAGEAV
jgi:hypothetical protein